MPKSHRSARRPRAGLALSFVLVVSAGGLAFGQAAKPAAAPAPSTPAPPLASYVPGTDLWLYYEFSGLDAHAAAWKATAAYKILNETPAGAMLETVVAQLIDQTLVRQGNFKVNGTEAVALAKHLAGHGFVFAAWGKADTPGGPPAVFVARGVFRNKEVRPAVARMLGGLSDPKLKAKIADVDGHKVALVKTAKGEAVVYWVDDARKEDLVVIPSMNVEADSLKAAAAVFAAIEKKAPTALEHAGRVALAKAEDGFLPVSHGFVDLAALPPIPAPPELGLQGVKGIDVRWGFQEKELVSIVRIAAPKPRSGVLGLFDQPTFSKATLPPIPEGVQWFSVFTLDAAKSFDRAAAIVKAINPQAGARFDAAAEQVKAKTRLRLKEDILAHIGPKVAVYVAPSKSSGGDARPAGLNPLLALLPGGTIPRVTVVAEIDNPVAFGRALDELMIVVNQSLRSMLPAGGPPALGAGAGPGGEPGKAAAKTTRAGAGSGMEFKLVPGPTKAFMLAVPAEFTAMLPNYVRPTIRVGPKHVVFSIAADSARAALEVKGSGAAESTFATALQPTPPNLVFLSAQDPGESLSAALASFPGKLQAMVNQARNPAAAAVALNPVQGAPGGSFSLATPGSSSGQPPGGSGSSSGSDSASIRTPNSSSSYPGSSSGPGMPGGPGSSSGSGSGSGATPGEGGAGPTGIILRVDPTKMPSAAAIRPLLFPGTVSVAVEDGGLRIVSREAFPNLGALVSGNPFAAMLAGRAAPVAPPGAGVGAPPAANPDGAAPAGPGPGSSGGPGRRRPTADAPK